MMITAMILSGLALLAAIGCVIKSNQIEKRNQKRNAALIRYIDRMVKKAYVDSGIYTDEHLKSCFARIEKLENGITPDYEQAKAAADAVNDFSKGITNILGFDPVEALKAERSKKETGGTE